MKKQSTVSFISDQQSNYNFINSNKYNKLQASLYNEIIELINSNYKIFYISVESELDIVICKLILDARRNYINKSIKLNIIIPYCDIEKTFSNECKKDFQLVKLKANKVEYYEKDYRDGIFIEISRFFVDNSNVLINISEYSTDYFKEIEEYASARGIRIIRIYEKYKNSV